MPHIQDVQATIEANDGRTHYAPLRNEDPEIWRDQWVDRYLLQDTLEGMALMTIAGFAAIAVAIQIVL